MGITLTLQNFLISLLPIATLIFLLLFFKLNAAWASLAGLVLATLIGTFYMNTSLPEVGLQALKGGWNAFGIFLVIAPAMLIYQMLKETDMFTHIRKLIDSVIEDELLRVLFVGWIFAGFLQSITGFGVPVAVCAPILVSLGFSPVHSVIISILGHAWGGTFGTLAIAWDSMILISDMKDPLLIAQTAINACLMLWIYNMICGFIIYGLYLKKSGRKRMNRREILYVIILSAVQGGGQLLAAIINPSVACFVGSVLSIIAIFLLNRLSGKKRGERQLHSDVPIRDILAPYITLILLVTSMLVISPVHDFLSQFKVGFSLPDTIGGASEQFAPISVFTHSGTILIITGIAIYIHYRVRGYIRRKDMSVIVGAALKKAGQAILPVLCLIIMSKVMDGTGQIAILAEGTAGAFRGVYPVVAPLIGILGSFICSSNMSSNILFTGFQSGTAQALGISPTVILAAQTAGGSIGNLLATGNIVLGLLTTKSIGREGEVLRFMFPISIAIGIVCGLFSLLLSLL